MDDLALTDQVRELKDQVKCLQQQLAQAQILPTAPAKDLPCFDPYRLPDGRIMTSTAVKSTAEWYERAYLIPHEPFRRDMIEVDYLLKNHVKADEPWKLCTFFGWYIQRFEKNVHSHHDVEEKIIFPAFKLKIDNFPEKQAADHKTLIAILNEITALEVEFKKLGGNAANIEASAIILPKLREVWSRMVVEMLPHLAEEEEFFITTMKDKFSEKEWQALTPKIIKSEGPANIRRFLPAIIDGTESWGTAKNQADFLAELPPPIRFMYRKWWRSSYLKYHRGALNALRRGAPPVVVKQPWY